MSHPPSPTLTFHPSILPLAVPTPALVDSVAGAAHYSGVHLEPDSPITAIRRRRSSGDQHTRHSSHTELAEGHLGVINDLSQLYGCKPSLSLLNRRWRRDAIYEDPLSKCVGFAECAAQWFWLAKVCSKSETLRTRVMSSTRSPNRLVFTQAQEYTIRPFGHKKVVESIIIIDMDDEDKITHIVDQWNGNELPTRFGILFLRRMSAIIRPWLVRVPES